jgi:uncharacterized DUF497 family protein
MTREIEFDPEKDTLNRQIHHVRLSTAALVFNDPMRIERVDDSESNTSTEERIQPVGKVRKVLFVVYTERGVKTRLISARTATAAERRSYNGDDTDNNKGWTKAD